MLRDHQKWCASFPRPTRGDETAPSRSSGLLYQLSQLHQLLSKWVFPKMVGFPNKPMGFPTKNDHFGMFWGKIVKGI